MRPDLSIVIVTYNNESIIRKSLESLSAVLASYTVELYIIDNNSSDATTKILTGLDSWKRLSFYHVERIYNSENLGYTRGVNQGLQKCRGRFVLLLNPDILFHQNPFPHLLTCLKDEHVGVVSPQFRFPDGRIQSSCRRFPTKQDVWFEFLGLSRLFRNSSFFNAWRFPDFDHRHSRNVEQPQGAFLLARAEVAQTVGLLDENLPMFFSDVDWCRRVYEHGWNIQFCSESFIYHIQGASVRQKRAEMITSSHRSFVDYFKKYDATWLDKCATFFVQLLLLTVTPLRLLTLKK